MTSPILDFKRTPTNAQLFEQAALKKIQIETCTKRIANAFRILKKWDNSSLAGDIMVDIVARDLALFRPLIRFWKNNETACSRATAAREIAEIKRLAESLHEAIVSAHEPTVTKLGLIGDPLSHNGLSAALFSLLYRLSKVDLSDVPNTANSGAPKKDCEAQIALRTAEHYYFLTGLMPTQSKLAKQGGKATGPFMDLLKVVFDEVGIKRASVENLARGAIAAFKRDVQYTSSLVGEAPPSRSSEPIEKSPPLKARIISIRVSKGHSL